jgi:DNA-directed RNA polymerase subunit RPC12/RpoP
MKGISCPHCGEKRIVSAKVPRDIVVIQPCPHCSEFVVLFRGHVVGIKRAILEEGTRDEKAQHLAEIFAQFIDKGALDGILLAGEPPEAAEAEDEADSGPISDEELDRFLRFELQRLDDPAYFRRHFG